MSSACLLSVEISVKTYLFNQRNEKMWKQRIAVKGDQILMMYSLSMIRDIKFLLKGYGEKAMAPHSNTLAWKIPWTEEPGGLQSMGL